MRLLKREVTTVNTRVLNVRYCELLQKGEEFPANEISVAEAREILWIEDELRERAIRAVGHDFYPPDRIEKKYPSNYMVSLLKQNKIKPQVEPGVKIKFKITVTSSIGSKAAEKDVCVDSRNEADLMANKMIRDLGLKRATYKIS